MAGFSYILQWPVQKSARLAAVAATFAATLLVAAPLRAAPPPPAEAFGALPRYGQLVISPDGGKIAWIETADGEGRVVVQSTDGSPPMVAPLGSPKPRGLTFSGDNMLVITASVTITAKNEPGRRQELVRDLAFDLQSRKTRWLNAGSDTRSNYVVTADRMMPGTSGELLYPVLEYNEARYEMPTGKLTASQDPYNDAVQLVVYRVDPASGRSVVHMRGERYTSDVAFDRSGQPIARQDLDPKKKQFSIWSRANGNWKRLILVDNAVKDVMGFVGLYPGGDDMLLWDDRDTTAGRTLVRLNLTTGETSPVFQDILKEGYQSAVTDPWSGEVLAIRGANNDTRHWLDPQLDAMQAKLNRSFKNKFVSIDRWSRDRSKLLVSVWDQSTPDMELLLDTRNGQALQIGGDYPLLANAALGTKSQIRYGARDGASIPAWLTTPPGMAAAKGLPLVVLPHGGPEAHDDNGFDWWAQFLATRGYLVLQPQFRGSTGYGKAFADAGRRQWGRLMQDDVSDGVKYLIASGQADARRVCIVGGSYGGYAALAGATLTPELYACAASIAGVADLQMMIGYELRDGQRASTALNYWVDHMGARSGARLDAVSPVNFAGNARAPILLIHGVDDSVVPFQQSEAMAAALKAAGKPYSFVRLDGEDHWLSRSETRIRMLKELDAFLARYLAPAAAATQSPTGH